MVGQALECGQGTGLKRIFNPTESYYAGHVWRTRKSKSPRYLTHTHSVEEKSGRRAVSAGGVP